MCPLRPIGPVLARVIIMLVARVQCVRKADTPSWVAATVVPKTPVHEEYAAAPKLPDTGRGTGLDRVAPVCC